MTDKRIGERPQESWPGEIDGAVRKLVTAIVLAGSLIALAIYSQDDPRRYQVTAADGRIVRVDTQSGTVIACQDKRCAIVLRRGQELDEALPPAAQPRQEALPKQEARPAQPTQPAEATANESAPATR